MSEKQNGSKAVTPSPARLGSTMWCWKCQKDVAVLRGRDGEPCPLCGYKMPAEHQTRVWSNTGRQVRREMEEGNE